jgi:hypothetical protein
MKTIKFLATFLSFSLYAHALLVVNQPTVTIYETPEEHGHIEDILRYGTVVEITDEKGIWAHVTYPEWHGWVVRDQLLEVEEDPKLHTDAVVGYRGAYLFKETGTCRGPFIHLPFETPLKIIKELPETHRRWVFVKLQDGRTGYVQRSQMMFSNPQLSMSEMVAFSQKFLGTKYLWGGTSSFGYDCSGFVQMLYRQMGMTLPRNSNQQAVDSRFKDVNPEEAQAGDLVFFRNSSGNIVHVGMMINGHDFIHSFTQQEAWICISSLADERFCNGYFYYGIEVRRLKQS